MNQIPTEWRRKYLCPVEYCQRAEHGFATLKEKKQHVHTVHAGTKKPRP